MRGARFARKSRIRHMALPLPHRAKSIRVYSYPCPCTADGARASLSCAKSNAPPLLESREYFGTKPAAGTGLCPRPAAYPHPPSHRPGRATALPPAVPCCTHACNREPSTVRPPWPAAPFRPGQPVAPSVRRTRSPPRADAFSGMPSASQTHHRRDASNRVRRPRSGPTGRADWRTDRASVRAPSSARAS